MKQLTGWAFDGADTARRAEVALGALTVREPLTLDDGAHLWWPGARRGPSFRGIENVALAAALGRGFWGLLFGAVFVAPTLSALSRLEAGTLDDLFRGVGITTDFLQQLRGAVVPDSSALVVLADVEALGRLDAALTTWRPQRADAQLSGPCHDALRAAFTG